MTETTVIRATSTRAPASPLPCGRAALALPALALSAPLWLASGAGVRADPVGATAAVWHWGDALVTGLQAAGPVLMPMAVTVAGAMLARAAGPLRFLVTSTLVERLVRNATDYAVNAVAGAVRGRTLTVPLGSAVIARAVQRALDQGPAWLIEAAGGPRGVAEKVFRSLALEEAADLRNTLAPGLREADPAPLGRRERSAPKWLPVRRGKTR